jgi:hypothetical protein
MRKSAVIVLLLFCFSPFVSGQKMRFGQDPETPKAPKISNSPDSAIKVHVSATHLRSYCANCSEELYADVILNGKKFELEGIFPNIKHELMLLVPGDYPVRLKKDIHNADSTALHQEYDLTLPDGTVWHCWTSGISE